MSELVADCPRCGAHSITFDVWCGVQVHRDYPVRHETFCVCRRCMRSTVFVLELLSRDMEEVLRQHGWLKFPGSVNNIVNICGFIGLRDMRTAQPPEHVPEAIRSAFIEGATCISTACFNAAGVMFRLCVDLATKDLLPDAEGQDLNNGIRRNLGLRLSWLFEQRLLPESLKELSTCIREDGNDGAHAGSLSKEDAADLLEFSKLLLERRYTEPAKLRIAKERRDKRRSTQQ